MNIQTKEKIAKIYELVKRGSTDGEKQAAEIALNKLLKKFNLTDEFLATIHLTQYEFKYATQLDQDLFIQLYIYFFKDKEFNISKSTLGRKSLFVNLEYLDYILFSTAYEYFKKHMNAEFRKFCLPLIAKCRTTKTKNKRRAELQKTFFSQYVMKSKIYHENQIEKIDLSKLSDKQYNDRKRLSEIEGGKYHTQVTTGLYLE
ncbi:hypothetical protein FPG87_12490 [Flavobacterium psychrophilum]|uniref:DUF2786 domain-containing protein n=1 Tax=Flavobacterium psychrophilum TaxID=96345 RepID=A0A7U2RC91_FLAPS|nr:hypothetical protein [Flavobacterium psychrophilum]MBF2091277.1 hypothetical protein [Flavobacterium psychrophilum]OAE92156.1 hypothetical protein SU65_10400 [Flavobacterium psychrophilum]OJH10060.1 hypothetical protein FPG87_12490 [Flavobacterium psychrophilum]QRE05312.1 hypothetical protein H0H26_06920 [Flavobacterium psychrophilum]SNA67033.1 conserved hypothetical protein [Flavobacterium psychrophilum]